MLLCIGTQTYHKKQGGRSEWTTKVYHIQVGIAHTILSSYQSIEKKYYSGKSAKMWGEILRKLCEMKGVQLIEGATQPDHVHMYVAIPPKLSVSEFVGYLKGKSALMVYDRHPEFAYSKKDRHLWARGYYVSTVGNVNEDTVRKYIRDQEEADKLED